MFPYCLNVNNLSVMITLYKNKEKEHKIKTNNPRILQ